MGVKKNTTNKKPLSLQEKLELLSETDLAYIRGYIDRAYAEQQKRLKHNKKPGN